MPLVDECPEGYLESVRDYAKSVNQIGQLNKVLGNLATWGGEGYRVRLMKDFAPYSFTFAYEALVDGKWTLLVFGGVIYHGKHDRGGDGGGPTYSVNLQPMEGWAIHT